MCVVLFVTQSVQAVVPYQLPNESLAHGCCVVSVRDQSGGPSSPTSSEKQLNRSTMKAAYCDPYLCKHRRPLFASSVNGLAPQSFQVRLGHKRSHIGLRPKPNQLNIVSRLNQVVSK